MQAIPQTLADHPRSTPASLGLRSCINACFDCALACTSCAAACTGRRHVDDLIRCIRLDLDCADLCETVGRALSRQARPDWDVLRIEIGACAAICEACALECEQHSRQFDHFSACARACRKCIDQFRATGFLP
jgi:hypothetical protein